MIGEYLSGEVQLSKHHGGGPIFGSERMLCSGVNGHRRTSEQLCGTLDESHSPNLGVGNGSRRMTVHSPSRRSIPSSAC
jgi:hypothetical protein